MPNEDIVFSSRVRLARNIAGLPFPHCMSGAQMEQLIEDVNHAINGNGDFMLMRMAELPLREKKLLVERHLVSPALAEAGRGAALIDKDEKLSILIGEEDHLRIQSIQPGLNLTEADTLCAAIDALIAQSLPYAFDAELGYLTACPTNVGSGMRASVMLHLPALASLGQADVLLGGMSKLGYAVRGYYGEGSGTPGHIYQISNQMTLGLLEEDIVSNLTGTVRKLMDRERAVRRPYYEKNRTDVEDCVFRSLGMLRYARKLNTTEAMEHLSNIKLGCGLGLLDENKQGSCNALFTNIQAAALEQRAGRALNAAERDRARANYIRDEIKTYFQDEIRGEE